VVNLFYLLNAFLQSIPAISTNSPLASLIPVVFMMIVGMCKEFAVEYKRFKDDSRVNSMKTDRMEPIAQLIRKNTTSSALTRQESTPKKVNTNGVSNFKQVSVADIKVGDILELHDDEQIPADCIILACDNTKGEVFVHTAALDGERNLKPKLAPKMVLENYSRIFCSEPSWDLNVQSTVPVKDLYRFRGKLTMEPTSHMPQDKGADNETKSAMLDVNQFLHRGAFIKNSGKVLALVIHTGTDTKLIMNLGQYNYKVSSAE